jgi:nucleotide-binding universal stress UspA family protein
MAAAAGVDCVTAVETGIAHREIVDYVENNDIGLVVMGSRGRSNLPVVASTHGSRSSGAPSSEM